VKPVLLVVAGPNGAGKTTVTERLRKESWSEGVEYINPDEIARDRFGDWNSPDAVLAAAKWAAARREELLAQGSGIAFETVLSTADKIEFLERARSEGYFIRLFFISTSGPEINGRRVTARVMEGGHTVPIEKIISRYARSMANLTVAVQIADRAYIYDNSVEDTDAHLYARTHTGQLRKVYGPLPQWVEDAVGSMGRHSMFEDLR
jgi:predicted ABC-type ATPase